MNAVPRSEVQHLATLDKERVWHPFTPLRDWCAPTHEPLVIVSGEGAVLRDAQGQEYIDGNSSIWTNLHGHCHPRLNAAITRQLGAFAHCSFLGQTHPVAVALASALVALFPPDTLTRVFFSDDGSTAIEVALRIAREFWLRHGQPARNQFLAFDLAYHGDTLGAASLGGIATFRGWQECNDGPLGVVRVGGVAELAALPQKVIATLAGAVIEPLVQGAAGMRLWPAGTLAALRAWCD
ncbi:MAG: aminotransferase class III-fold pyridoxal phosphate-dependent enzyme, partial [Verrucomicrobia bacterium]|nr:aminotransferase class III-fold pyridoxal phosphate-dependent enzyme [Verrucomicrobiota bacterium]